MKKTLTVMAIIAFITCFISISIGQTPDKKSQKAREKLQEAQKDSINPILEQLKKESAIKFASNEKSMASYKTSIVNEKKKAKANDEKKLANLEQKNSYLKTKLNDYKIVGKENWAIFKAGFNQDMDALTKALSDLTSQNAK